MIKKISIIIIIFLLLGAVLLLKDKLLVQSTPSASPQTQVEQLKIISTSPNPLDEATISPTQTVEITFNKPIKELKMKTDPENLEYNLETVDNSSNHSQTYKISFKKPLELGGAVTLFILTNTQSKEGNQSLDKEYVYHIKTVSYRGI